MAILFDANSSQFRLVTRNTEYQIKVDKFGVLSDIPSVFPIVL